MRIQASDHYHGRGTPALGYLPAPSFLKDSLPPPTMQVPHVPQCLPGARKPAHSPEGHPPPVSRAIFRGRGSSLKESHLNHQQWWEKTELVHSGGDEEEREKS